MKIIAAAISLLVTAHSAFAIETCDIDARVLTADGLSGVIIGGPVADMCVVRLADGNMTPINMTSLTTDTSEPAPTDIRSIVPGVYGCQDWNGQSNDIVLEIEIRDANRYAIADEGEGTWEAYDALTIQFLDGPLAGRFANGQNSTISVSRTNDGAGLYCKVRG